MWGLLSGLLALGLFYSMILLTQQQVPKDKIYRLEQAYKDEFMFDEVENIHTLDALQDFLHRLSLKTRRMMVVSADRFEEQESQVKLSSKFERFDRAKNIESADLSLRVDSRVFTLTAWTRRPTKRSAGYVLRKPIDLTDEGTRLQCWAWYVDDPPRFEYGFHDYGVMDFGDESFQEVVEADGDWSRADPTHFEAVIVTEHNISFYRDGNLKSTVPIKRRVTDCE